MIDLYILYINNRWYGTYFSMSRAQAEIDYVTLNRSDVLSYYVRKSTRANINLMRRNFQQADLITCTASLTKNNTCGSIKE